jgi:hypothetical protein
MLEMTSTICRRNSSASDNATITLTVPTGGMNGHHSFRYFDISNASTSLLDNNTLDISTDVSGYTTVSSNSVITPNNNKGVAIAFGTMNIGPGLSVTSLTGAIFDFCTCDTEQDGDSMENADCVHMSTTTAPRL